MKNNYFLYKAAEQINTLQNEGKEVLVILPNQRAGMYIKKYMSALIDRPIFLPDMQTMESYLFRRSGLQKVEVLELYFLLYDAYVDVFRGRHTDDFDTFLTWSGIFLNDCNDLDNALVDGEVFFTTLFEDRQIRNWDLDNSLTLMQEKYLEFWQNSHALYTEFTARLRSSKLAYAGLAYREGVDKIGKEGWGRAEAVVFVGFNALNEAEKRAFQLAREAGIGVYLWDADVYYVDDRWQKAGEYLRDNIAQLSPEYKVPEQIGKVTKEINIIEAPTDSGQCDVAVMRLKDILAKIPPSDYDQTAIILADETLLDTLLLRLPEEGYTYNITMGKSLSSFGLYAFFDKFFNYFEERRSEISSSDSVLKLIASPYISILDSGANYGILKEDIIKGNGLTIDLNNDRYGAFWKILQSTELTPVSIIEMMTSILFKLRNHYYTIEDKTAVEYLFELYKVFNQLISALERPRSFALSLPSCRRLFRELVGKVSLPFEGEPIQGIQIMGFLETRSLDFKNIILLSANEGFIPEARSTQTYIPHAFRKYFKLPTHADRDAIFAYSFYRLLHRVERLDIIYGNAESELASGERSRYIEQLYAEYMSKTSGETEITAQSMIYGNSRNTLGELRVEKGDEVKSSITNYMVNKRFSATALNQLLRNPLDFYLQRIIGFREPPSLELTMENNTFGSIVHHCLEHLYMPSIGKLLTQADLQEYKKGIQKQLDISFESEYPGSDITTGTNKLYYDGAYKLVEEVINIDLSRVERHEIRIIGLEMKAECTLVVDLENIETVKIYGELDRVQWCDDEVEIIDYKTGSVKNSNMKTEDVGENYTRDKALQLLIYAWLLNENQIGKCFPLEKIKPCLLALKSWEQGLHILPDYREVLLPGNMLEFKERIREVIEGLMKGRAFDVEEENNRNTYSPFIAMYT